MKSPGAWFVIAALILSSQAAAEHIVSIEPSIAIIQVHDNNLNFSPETPMRDQIRRITPALALRFDSPRWRARATYGVDSESFATHSGLDNARARERALIGIQYEAGPRLSLLMDSGYIETDTLTDLNVETGLATSRIRGRRLGVGPSVRFQISPRLKVAASASSITTSVKDGRGMREQVQTLVMERRMTSRDRFSVDYEHSHVGFDSVTTPSLDTHIMLAGWTRDLGARSFCMLQAGPRMTRGSPAADFSASLTQNRRFSSYSISLQRHQTTVVGYPGAVDTQSLQGRLTWISGRKLISYAAPAIIRSTRDQFEGTVYRLGLGTRYEITPMLGFDVAYNIDRQKGGIEPLWANSRFSHATVSVGFATRWNSADKYDAGAVR